jgi:hypothetical protein
MHIRISFALLTLFQDNRYFGEPAHGALITGNGIQNRLAVQNCQFQGNDMVFNNKVVRFISQRVLALFITPSNFHSLYLDSLFVVVF